MITPNVTPATRPTHMHVVMLSTSITTATRQEEVDEELQMKYLAKTQLDEHLVHLEDLRGPFNVKPGPRTHSPKT